MKGKIKAVLIAILACVFCAAFAAGCAPEPTYYTVTFMDGEKQVGVTSVEKGKRITEFPTVTHEDEYDYLDGWCLDVGLSKVWNENVERVTKDVTLYAKFLHITNVPNNASMEAEAFSNTLTWLQRGVNEQTAYSIALYGGEKVSQTDYEYTQLYCTEENPSVTVENYKGEPDIFKVKWTVADKPLGGIYAAKVTCAGEEVTFGGLLYKGAGTEQNPYLINDATDFSAINTQNIPQGAYYRLINNIVVRSASSKVAGFTFDGNLDGNGKNITIEASDCGLFATLGQNAVVCDLTVDGSVPGASGNCAGIIAAVNNGSVSYCNVSATITSELGTIGVLEQSNGGITGGAGGLIGINNGVITNCAFTGTVQASVGAGGIAAVNNAEITLCTLGGTLGAGNSNETGSSTRKYSYMGGIAAINNGVISGCGTTGSGKLLAQRSESGESPNNNIGGIAALNAAGAAITECWFDGIRVHGNKNVGGIAGENAGYISYCFSAAVYKSGSGSHSYIGGYASVGGIVGLTAGGTVEKCFVTADVYAYGAAAYSIAETSLNSIYIGGNLDLRSGTAELSAPVGNDNSLVQITDADRAAYATKTYVLTLTEEQFSLLNSGKEEGNFIQTSGTVRLAKEDFSTVKEHVIHVTLNGGADRFQTYEISNIGTASLPLSSINADAKEGFYLVGWSLKEGGKAVLGTKATGYAELSALGLKELNLYPVYAEGEDPMDKVLNVAVYSQYVEEDIIKALLGAFEAYCAENGIAVNGLTYTMIGGASTNVASFCSAVAQGEYNVMFGHRANLTISVIGSVDTLLKVDGTARRIAKLSEGTASTAFYNFVLTNAEAKKILDPTYVEEEKNQDALLSIAVFTRYIGSKEYATNLVAAFAASSGVDIEQIALDFIGDNSTSVASFGATVNAGKYDIILACGSNIATTGGVAYLQRTEIDVKGQTGRYAAILTETETAQEFYSFLETDEAKLALNPDYVSSPEEPEEPEEQYDLVIAIHSSASNSTYITQEEIENLKALFAAYLADDTVRICWIVVESTDVAGFGAEVNDKDNAVDIAIGGNTMNTTGKISFDASGAKVAVKAGLFANTSRYVGVVSGSTSRYADTFYQFMTQN